MIDPKLKPFIRAMQQFADKEIDGLDTLTASEIVDGIEGFSDEEILSLAMPRPGHADQYGFMYSRIFSREQISEIAPALMKRLGDVKIPREEWRRYLRQENKIFSADSPNETKVKNEKLLYRVAPSDGLVFATQEDAKNNAKIRDAIENSKTWGQFRWSMPSDEYDSIIENMFDDSGEPRPADDDEFSMDEIPGFSDGDYPGWLQQEMEYIIPMKILQEFGIKEDSVLNGPYWQIPESNKEAICQGLEDIGFELEEAGDLNFY